MHQAPKQGDPVLPIDNISVDFRRRDSESSALIETVIYYLIIVNRRQVVLSAVALKIFVSILHFWKWVPLKIPLPRRIRFHFDGTIHSLSAMRLTWSLY